MTEAIDLMLEREVSVYSIQLWNLSLLSNYVRRRERARESSESSSLIAPLHRCIDFDWPFPPPLLIKAPNGSLISQPLSSDQRCIT